MSRRTFLIWLVLPTTLLGRVLHAHAELRLQQRIVQLCLSLRLRSLLPDSPSGSWRPPSGLLRRTCFSISVNVRCCDRQLGCGEAERLLRQRLFDAVHFVQHALARLDLGTRRYSGIALAVRPCGPPAGLRGDRLVRETRGSRSAAAALDVARHCLAGDASICRAVRRPRPSAFPRPYSPNVTPCCRGWRCRCCGPSSACGLVRAGPDP